MFQRFISTFRFDFGKDGRIQIFWMVSMVCFLAVASQFWPATTQDSMLTGDVIESPEGWADERRCAECHEQAGTFLKTGHANTLQRASEPSSLELLQHWNLSSAGSGTSIRLVDGKPVVSYRNGSVERELSVDWCFGSGAHARTWACMLTDSQGASDLLELRYTWYHRQGGFDVTPGQPAEGGPDPLQNLGMQFDGPKAQRCFSCHATRVPMLHGNIVLEDVVPGVHCQRCHGPRGQHVASNGQTRDPRWQFTDRMDSVRRCGQCHRMAEEREPHEIRPDNPDIVRFQPMGLLNSACFKQSEMTCTTCHDPHKPLNEQDSLGLWQCRQCHDPERPEHTLCSQGEREDCLKCHMPKVEMKFPVSSPVSFTDHWIRIPTTAEKSP